MADNENGAVAQVLTPEMIVMAQALQKANKPKQAKKEIVLAAIVEFLNTGEALGEHFETRFPSKNANGLNVIIRENAALRGKVIATDTEQFGVCLTNLAVASELLS